MWIYSKGSFSLILEDSDKNWQAEVQVSVAIPIGLVLIDKPDVTVNLDSRFWQFMSDIKTINGDGHVAVQWYFLGRFLCLETLSRFRAPIKLLGHPGEEDSEQENLKELMLEVIKLKKQPSDVAANVEEQRLVREMRRSFAKYFIGRNRKCLCFGRATNHDERS